MDYESIKRLGLDHIGIDPDLSYETYDSTTNNHTIFVHLLKQDIIVCPLCGVVNDSISRGSKPQLINYSSGLEEHITLKLFRRVRKCKSCGYTFKESNPLSDGHSISYNTQLKILAELKNMNMTYKDVAEKFHVSPTYVTYLFDKKVDIQRGKLPKVLCVDEVYSRHLSFYSYCFILYSPRAREIIDIYDSRRVEDIGNKLNQIPFEERCAVEFFSMDLYKNYRDIAKEYFPKAKICADPFHVIKNLSQSFHKLRIRLMQKYSNLKDQRDNYYWFFKSYWKLLTIDRSKLSHKKFRVNQQGQYLSTFEIVEYILKLDTNLNTAYELLHEYRTFNSTATIHNAEEWLDELILKFQSSGIKEYIPAWNLLKNWHDEIINSFNIVEGKRVSNGPMERANEDIKTIFRLAHGSNNFKRMRNRVMYVMNSGASILYSKKKESNKRKFKKRGKYKK